MKTSDAYLFRVTRDADIELREDRVAELDAVVAAPELPPGTIQLKLVDAHGRPLAGADVSLGINFNKISEGEQRTEQRAKIMALSDPIHYFKNGITQLDKNNWSSLKDLEGKKVGTITGFSFIPEMRKIKGLQVALYDTSDAAVRDLLAGRIDAVIGDPPVMQYAISRNPQWKLKFNAFTDNSPEFPLLTGLGQVVFGLSKDNPELVKAVNAEIAKMWQTCELRKIGKSYGLVQDVWFVPSGQNTRAGVDRPANWSLPSCKPAA